jgi:hypothetical protein
MLSGSSLVLFILSTEEKAGGGGVSKGYKFFSVSLKPSFDKLIAKIELIEDKSLVNYIYENYNLDSLKKRYELGFESIDQILENMQNEKANALKSLITSTTSIQEIEKNISWGEYLYKFGVNNSHIIIGVVVGVVAIF